MEYHNFPAIKIEYIGNEIEILLKAYGVHKGCFELKNIQKK